MPLPLQTNTGSSSGIQTLNDLYNLINGTTTTTAPGSVTRTNDPLSQVQTSSGGVSTKSISGGTTTKTETGSMDQAGMNAMLQSILTGTSGVPGLAAISSGQHTAGGYGSSVNTLLTNDLITRAAGEIAKANSSKTTTINAPTQTETITTPQTSVSTNTTGGGFKQDTTGGSVIAGGIDLSGILKTGGSLLAGQGVASLLNGTTLSGLFGGGSGVNVVSGAGSTVDANGNIAGVVSGGSGTTVGTDGSAAGGVNNPSAYVAPDIQGAFGENDMNNINNWTLDSNDDGYADGGEVSTKKSQKEFDPEAMGLTALYDPNPEWSEANSSVPQYSDKVSRYVRPIAGEMQSEVYSPEGEFLGKVKRGSDGWLFNHLGDITKAALMTMASAAIPGVSGAMGMEPGLASSMVDKAVRGTIMSGGDIEKGLTSAVTGTISGGVSSVVDPNTFSGAGSIMTSLAMGKSPIGAAISSLKKNFNGGGEVSGAGTSTSDSVDAKLSDGETVVTAKTTQKVKEKFGPDFFINLEKMFNAPAAMVQMQKGRA